VPLIEEPVGGAADVIVVVVWRVKHATGEARGRVAIGVDSGRRGMRRHTRQRLPGEQVTPVSRRKHLGAAFCSVKWRVWGVCTGGGDGGGGIEVGAHLVLCATFFVHARHQ